LGGHVSGVPRSPTVVSGFDLVRRLVSRRSVIADLTPRLSDSVKLGEWPEIVCAENPNEYFRGRRADVPTADKPDF
jgi:hypothetical protein